MRSNLKLAKPAVPALSEDELRHLEETYCSHGDTVHYTDKPKFFSGCEGSFVYDAAETPFLDLQKWLLTVTLAGVAVFAIGSVVFARRITTPLRGDRCRQRDAAGVLRIEHHEGTARFADDAREGVEHGHLFGAGRLQVFQQQRLLRRVQLR